MNASPLVDLEHLHSGKVRELYAVGEDRLLLVASDRLSAFDVVMAEPIAEKGRVLTAMTQFWCEVVADVAPCALVSCDPAVIEAEVPGFAAAPELAGRTMLASRAEMVPIECVVRGRLAGSAYNEYCERGTINSMPAPKGLELTDPLPEPMFTPSTKESPHDVNISFDDACDLVGTDLAHRIRELCLAIFERAQRQVAAAGIVLADTKFELGLIGGELVLCDEVVTPDSSRLWPMDAIVRGAVPPAFDKQPFRDWLAAQPWDRTPPPPRVPDDVALETSHRYVAAYERVTERSLRDWYGRST